MKDGKSEEQQLIHVNQKHPGEACMGGTHLFHDTSLAEMTHRDNIGWASLRSRTYHDVNESSVAMLEFLNEDQLLEAICAQAAVDDDSGEDEEESDAGDPNPHHMPTPYAHTIYPHHIPTQYAHTICPHHIREFSLTLHPHPNQKVFCLDLPGSESKQKTF